MRIPHLAAVSGLAVLGLSEIASATPTDTARQPARLDRVEIVEDPNDPRKMSGSVYVVSEEDLEKFEHTDIHRILRDVPGVYFQEEDGLGLRPNIGIRGSGSGRNEKISVMEDGILVAPAPYAAPAAYYFPTAGRMRGVEVLKGPDTLLYGPFTVGGALNLLSTSIPEQASGMLNAEVGAFGTQKLHGHYGATEGQWGLLLETYQKQVDGFQDIDRSDRGTGYDTQDYVAKLRWRSAADAVFAQQVDIKAQYSDEYSDQSYIGLTEADFRRDSTRRYGLTERDRMENRHKGFSLRHQIAFGLDTVLASTVYRNETARNWYKVDRINGQSISAFLNSANNGNAAAQAALDGSADVAGIQIKANDRSYTAQGVQFELSQALFTGDVRHDVVTGVRWHQDEVDRFQPVDVFDQINGSLVYQSSIAPTGSNNALEDANAFSAWLMDHITLGDLRLTTALRYEDINTRLRQYGDPGRTVISTRRSNNVNKLTAGLGATYALDEVWTLLAGVHQGFAPAGAGADRGNEGEESLNYELGARFRDGSRGMDAILFYSDYRNAVQNCSVAVPCAGGATTGSTQQGEADVYGLELALTADLYSQGAYTVPGRLAYTHTRNKITKSSDDGSVLYGDNLSYLPEHVASATVGLEHSAGWKAYASLSYVSSMCIDNQCDREYGIVRPSNRLFETDSYVTVDLAAAYPLTPAAEVYVKVDNVFDEEKIVARSPAGARVNMPRYVGAGVRLSF